MLSPQPDRSQVKDASLLVSVKGCSPVGGQGIFTLNNEKRRVSAGDTVAIPTGSVHRIEHDGASDLIIETQLGVCFEEDMMRLEDD
jgi:mannose-6-phosphate isomerase-like protein (cupin superfamily)